MNPYSKSNLIVKAASLARGDRLSRLRLICETQKTLTTRKLEHYLDKLADDMQQDAIMINYIIKNGVSDD